MKDQVTYACIVATIVSGILVLAVLGYVQAQSESKAVSVHDCTWSATGLTEQNALIFEPCVVGEAKTFERLGNHYRIETLDCGEPDKPRAVR